MLINKPINFIVFSARRMNKSHSFPSHFPYYLSFHKIPHFIYMHVFNHYISDRQLRISFQLINGISRSTHHIFHVNAINARNAFFIRRHKVLPLVKHIRIYLKYPLYMAGLIFSM